MRITILTFLAWSLTSAMQSGEWLLYRNDDIGIQFRYPPNLELVVRTFEGEPRPAPTVETVRRLELQLFAREVDPKRVYLERAEALRILVYDVGPRGRDDRLAQMRRAELYRPILVGQRVAGVYVQRGRGARHWQVAVPGTREVTIFSMDPDEDAKEGPEDARYPLSSIIGSVVFGPTFPQ